MSQLAACSLLLLLLSWQYGLSCQDKVALRTLPSNVEQITCTGDLVCEKSEMWCMPGDIIAAEYPVLVPSSIEAETVRRCQGDNCSLCVQLTVNISVAFLTERTNEELGTVDCDYDGDYGYYSESDEDEHEEEQEEREAPTVNVYLRLNSSNGSYLCAYLFISPSSYSCHTMRVSLPSSSVPQTHNTSSLVVGSIIYSCINVTPSTELYIMSYTVPRYSSVLSTSYEVPGCLELDGRDNIWLCGTPTLDFDGTSIGIVNGKNSNNRTITVRLYYDFNATNFNTTRRSFTLAGEQRHNISQWDVVPCLCISAWYNDLIDAVRTPVLCPFRNYSDELTLNKSTLEVRNEKLAVYTLNASCSVTAEASLCWKSVDQSDCREIPNTRRTIVSKEMYEIEGLDLRHPSLCVQVAAKGEVLHTKCLNVGVSPLFRNEAIFVYEHKHNISVCQVEVGGCKVLYDATHQVKRDLEFIEERMVEDVMSDRCIKIISGPNRSVYVCFPDKYLRSRWIWSRVLCLLIVAIVLLVLLLKNEDLKRWLKSMTAEKSLGEIFKDRRVLILYSPDSPAYEELVRVFATSLKELRLDVVLDQWNRTEMSLINPLPWYQKQKELVLEKGGMIIVLFSEGARERYLTWKDQKPQPTADSDPYGTFGAVLNCIYSDFEKKQAKGNYLVACFDFFDKEHVVPEHFRSLRTHTLPLNLVMLLRELAGHSAKRLKTKQAKRLSTMMGDLLKAPMQMCQDSKNGTTVLSQTGSKNPESGLNDGGAPVELQPLMD